MEAVPPPDRPVRLVDVDDLRRARLLVLFRPLLALPHLVWLGLWTLLVVPVAPAAWLVASLTGWVPSLLRRFLAAYVRYVTHLVAFVSLVGGPFPGFSGAAGSYPVDASIAPAVRQSRVTVLTRAVLAVPALVVAGLYCVVLLLVWVLGLACGLLAGRIPARLQRPGAAGVRTVAQTGAYLLLVTGRYPQARPVLRGDGEPT